MLYPVAIIQKDGMYYAQLPDIPELKVSGENMADTISCARTEVIKYLQTLAEQDKPLPSGSDISNYLTQGDYAGWTWAIVHIGASRIIGEDVAITLNVPERTLQKLISRIDPDDECADVESYILDIIKRHLVQDSSY